MNKLIRLIQFFKLNNIYKKAAQIKLLILDVDGVLSDGGVYMSDDGKELKKFSVLDGVGIKMLHRTGVEIAIITGSHAQAIQHRMQFLGIKHVFLGQERKMQTFNELKTKLNLKDKQIAYVGDDIPDIPLLKQVGLAITVANASSLVKKHAAWITKNSGASNVVREVCELIMRAQHTLQTQREYYFYSK